MIAPRSALPFVLLPLVFACQGTQPSPSTSVPDAGRTTEATPPSSTEPKADDEIAADVNRGDVDAARERIEQTMAPPLDTGGKFWSDTLHANIVYLPTVFAPHEAEYYVLPFLRDHAWVFKGKNVYELGTGSGMLSLFAAKSGARHVVATDINEKALESTRINAKTLGVSDRIETRLVPAEDGGAWSVIGKDERFDVIVSNPPYNLDLDAPENTPLMDKGDVGFSLVRGLQDHLTKDGVAILFFNSLFYHQVMVKYAEYLGYEVKSHNALAISPWELEALFNLYLKRILVREGLPEDAFRFDYLKDNLPFAVVIEQRQFKPEAVPLLKPTTGRLYRGFLTIRRTK